MAGQEIKKLSDFPAVEKLLQSKSLALQLKKLPRPVATSVIQATIRQAKQEFKTNKRVLTQSGSLPEPPIPPNQHPSSA